MLVTAIKKNIILFCCWAALMLAIPVASADSVPSLEVLTELTIDLRREMLETEERLSNLDKNNLSIYLNVNNLPRKSIQDVIIKLDGQQIAQLKFDDVEYKTLAEGAMKKLFSATVSPGKHSIEASINNEPDAPYHATQSMTLEKGAGKDVLKITLTNLMRDSRPGIFFDHMSVEAK